jgi:hypothetical protein
MVREYMRNQEHEDKPLDQMKPLEMTCHRSGGPTKTEPR